MLYIGHMSIYSIGLKHFLFALGMVNVSVAGAVYLKNMILHHWMNSSSSDATSSEFVIHDNAKTLIRDNIIDAVIVSENLIRSVHPEFI